MVTRAVIPCLPFPSLRIASRKLTNQSVCQLFPKTGGADLTRGTSAGCCPPPSRSPTAHIPLCQTSRPAGQCRGRPFPRAVAGQVSSWGIWREKLNSGGELGQLCAQRARWDPGTLRLVPPRSPPVLVTPERRHSGAFPPPPH